MKKPVKFMGPVEMLRIINSRKKEKVADTLMFKCGEGKTPFRLLKNGLSIGSEDCAEKNILVHLDWDQARTILIGEPTKIKIGNEEFLARAPVSQQERKTLGCTYIRGEKQHKVHPTDGHVYLAGTDEASTSCLFEKDGIFFIFFNERPLFLSNKIVVMLLKEPVNSGQIFRTHGVKRTIFLFKKCSECHQAVVKSAAAK